MFVTKDTIIAEILQNDPTQGCVPIFLATGMHCLGCMAAHGETLEQAGRMLRYDFLEEAKAFFGADKIAVAHHMDDQAESILLHLVRGSGLMGLCGMAPRRGDIIRPLLCLSKAEIESYLTNENLPYCTDATNFIAEGTRNKLRLETIPYLKREFNPRLVESLCAMGEMLSEDEGYLCQIAENELNAARRECGFDRAAFLRNDKSPGLATLGVLCGGIFNIFGDYFFVFTCDMGIYGAGLATAIGAVITTVIQLTHFVSRKNTLRLIKPEKLRRKLCEISVTGFSTFFIDVAMGILTVLFNRQIMRCLSTDALAIYGPIIQISTFVQCCGYSVGQASQPIMSMNFGAGKGDRIRETLRFALWTAAFFGVFWTALSMACPDLYVRIFMTPTPEILAMAPAIVRTYALSFLLLPFNIFSTYYFQAIMKPKAAFVVSVARGLVISGSLILVLPRIAGGNALWLTMPITELLVALYSASALRRYTLTLPEVQ